MYSDHRWNSLAVVCLLAYGTGTNDWKAVRTPRLTIIGSANGTGIERNKLTLGYDVFSSTDLSEKHRQAGYSDQCITVRRAFKKTSSIHGDPSRSVNQ